MRRRPTARRRCTGRSYRGDKELADLLIRAGANVKAANREGATPLWLASVNGDAAIIAALLERRRRSQRASAARTDAADDGVAHRQCRGDEGAARPRRRREREGNLRGTTPLMWAADEGHPAAVQLLIERGADIKAASNPAPRGRGPALGKANDPRRAVAAQGAALAAGKRRPIWAR